MYEGRAHGLNLIEEGSVGETPSKKPQKIAVKTLRKGATEEDKAGFLKEAQLMSKFKHPHILQLIGICLDNDPNFILLELMEAGDLASFLRKPVNRQRLTQADLCKISHDVSKGCAYLEEMHFVHRDIAARNCLVSSINPEIRKVRHKSATLWVTQISNLLPNELSIVAIAECYVVFLPCFS